MTVIQALKPIPDRRSRRGRQYPLVGTILAIVLLAAIRTGNGPLPRDRGCGRVRARTTCSPSPALGVARRCDGCPSAGDACRGMRCAATARPGTWSGRCRPALLSGGTRSGP
jgi:hypothetical protein